MGIYSIVKAGDAWMSAQYIEHGVRRCLARLLPGRVARGKVKAASRHPPL
jgi:hypothetical protein